MLKFIFSILFCTYSLLSFATGKADTTTPPFKKYPDLPAFNLLMMDSSTIFNTYNIQEGRTTLLMFFSPDCDHCEMITDSLIKNMAALKNVQICMFTIGTLPELKAFYDKKQLKQYKNVLVGKDYEIFFPRFYKAAYVPGLAIYDRKKKFVKYYEGGARMKDLLDALK